MASVSRGGWKEPDGVDFIISGKPLTEKEKKAISEFIKADKEKIASQKFRKVKSAKIKKLANAYYKAHE